MLKELINEAFDGMSACLACIIIGNLPIIIDTIKKVVHDFKTPANEIGQESSPTQANNSPEADETITDRENDRRITEYRILAYNRRNLTLFPREPIPTTPANGPFPLTNRMI